MDIRTLIVDDEPLARDRLRRALESLAGFVIAGECADGDSAVEAIEREDVDLVLLDVQMPGLDGFGVLAAVGAERMPAVVFVTAHDEYAVRAFEVCALDYVTKPWDRDRLSRALARARADVERQRDGALVERLTALLEARRNAEASADRIVVRAGARVAFVELAEITWIEAAANYARVHCGANEYLARETLKSLADRLPRARFVRIHRSMIVNVDHLRELAPDGEGEHVVVLRDGTRLRCGRAYREELGRFGQGAG